MLNGEVTAKIRGNLNNPWVKILSGKNLNSLGEKWYIAALSVAKSPK